MQRTASTLSRLDDAEQIHEPSVGPLATRTTIVHDWLVSYGGSERVVEELRVLLPNSRLVTSVQNRGALPPGLAEADTTILQRIPGMRRHYQLLLPLMPAAWRAFGTVRDSELLVSSSHACAKAVRSAPEVPHICYCHTPMRYAWDFESERRRLPRYARAPARLGMSAMRHWDASTASRVTQFVANSSAVAERIANAYGRDARVVNPPVRTEFFTPGGSRRDYFLYVGRLVAYKRADVVVSAFAELPDEQLIVVGQGHLEPELRARATANVTFVPHVDDDELRTLYREARALVYPANEDFGIAMAEAQACGTPVIALAAGGAFDIVDHGRTGWLVNESNAHEVSDAIRNLPDFDNDHIRAHAARFSRARFHRELTAVINDVMSS